MNSVLYLFGLILAVVAVAMGLTALFAQTIGETEEGVIFLLSAALTGFFGGGFIFGLRGSEARLTRMEAISLTSLLWFIVPCFIALPIVTAAVVDGPVQALYEAFSAFTTTGSTTFRSIDQLPRSILLWRAMSEWLGGFATLMTVLLLLAPANIGGVPDRPMRSVEIGSSSARARILGTGARILPVYALTTFTCTVLLGIGGLPPLEAICLAFSTLSTGGFMPGIPSIEAYDSRFIEAVLALFMLIGGSSVVWQRHILSRRWQSAREYNEFRWMVILAVVIGGLFAANLRWGEGGISGLTLSDAAWAGVLSSISVITTTGFEVREGGYSALSLPLLIGLALVGGAGYSTAGGFKLYRFGAMLTQAKRELRRLVYPHGMTSMRYGVQEFDLQTIKAMWVALMSLIGAVGVSTMVLASFGIAFEPALLAAVSAISNVGGIYAGIGDSIEGWIPYADMPPAMLITLIVTMAVGRVEILAVLIFLNRYFWRS